MIKLYICCPVLIIGSVEVGLDIDMKFHQEVMEIVSYDIPIDYAPMQDLSIDIKHMPIAFGGYQYLLVITCDQTNFTIVTPLRSRDAQSVAEALICRVIYLFGPPRQIICNEAAEFTSHIVQAILHMLNCKLKVISPYNLGVVRSKDRLKPSVTL